MTKKKEQSKELTLQEEFEAIKSQYPRTFAWMQQKEQKAIEADRLEIALDVLLKRLGK